MLAVLGRGNDIVGVGVGRGANQYRIDAGVSNQCHTIGADGGDAVALGQLLGRSGHGVGDGHQLGADDPLHNGTGMDLADATGAEQGYPQGFHTTPFGEKMSRRGR